jgi:hypothetical protein
MAPQFLSAWGTPTPQSRATPHLTQARERRLGEESGVAITNAFSIGLAFTGSKAAVMPAEFAGKNFL